MRKRVTISGKVTDRGEVQDKTRRISQKEHEAGNVRDAVIQAMDACGLDGFTVGEFSIKVSDPSDDE